MRRRGLFLMGGVLLLAAMAVRHPTADIRIITHEVADPAPQKVEAAIDAGVFAFHLLVTWTAKGLSVG